MITVPLISCLRGLKFSGTTVQICVKPSIIPITFSTVLFAPQQLSRSHQCQVNGKCYIKHILNDIFSGRSDKACGSRSHTVQVVRLLFPRSVLVLMLASSK